MPKITYRQLIEKFYYPLKKHLGFSEQEELLKIPKGKYRFSEQEEVSLLQSIIYDPERKQWFAIKPHTSENKKDRAESFKSKYSLLSQLAPINLDDIVPDEFLPEHLYTQIKKTFVIEPKHESQAAKYKEHQEEVAQLATMSVKALSKRSSLFRSDCFERKPTSPVHAAVRKIETITDFLPGDDLTTYLEKYKLTLSDVLELSMNILWAVMLLQNRGIVHGDLKTEHFIIKEKDEVKIIDFESAGLIMAGETMPVRGPYTPAYGAPEAFIQVAIGFPADCFSMGVVISDMFGLSLPFANRGLMIMDICSQLKDRSAQSGCAGHVKRLRKALDECASQVPLLQYDEAIAMMRANFKELDDLKLMPKIEPLLRVIVDVINALTVPSEQDRDTVDDAYFALSDLLEKFTEIFGKEEAPEAMEISVLPVAEHLEAQSVTKDESKVSKDEENPQSVFATGYGDFFFQKQTPVGTPQPISNPQELGMQDIVMEDASSVVISPVSANS